ncbi:hypothetical protein BD779DRAFT_1476129 [Infundibulicybe gibba]|nr:hypothetical protein BD779DRAFT_1476129 [Infundibulicybe gibba]
MSMALAASAISHRDSWASSESNSNPNSSTRLRHTQPFPPNPKFAARNPPNTAHDTQHWRTRALTAEALLAAQHTHTSELRAVLAAADAKRQSEVASVAREYEARYAGMERAFYILAATLLTVLALAAYALHKRPTPSRAAMHFTVPILSPWTSVVEHETSVVGAKALIGLALVGAGLLYLVARRCVARVKGGRPLDGYWPEISAAGHAR